MNLLLVERGEIGEDGTVRIGGRRAEHIRKVLRAEAGQTLRAGVIGGGACEAKVTSIDAEGVTLALAVEDAAPPEPWIDLIVGLPRPAVLHRVLQTVAAMGVGRLDLTNAWRVEKSFFHSPALREEAIRKHLLLGAEQGMTTRLPEVRLRPLLVPFVGELAERADPPCRLLAHPGAAEPLEAALENGCVQVAIGPEGGWIDREIETLEQAGFRPVTLGPWILRVETAVTAALAQVELARRAVSRGTC
ncbi:MAG: 16S rRNA (uracil(1498)-N(3))-methyltransferase [bacterium]|nr:16S rRNA (uracil(1498)-N(3))-methyltransferase [bacterium]